MIVTKKIQNTFHVNYIDKEVLFFNSIIVLNTINKIVKYLRVPPIIHAK